MPSFHLLLLLFFLLYYACTVYITFPLPDILPLYPLPSLSSTCMSLIFSIFPCTIDLSPSPFSLSSSTSPVYSHLYSALIFIPPSPVNALEQAKAQGCTQNAEDILQTVAERVHARQKVEKQRKQAREQVLAYV